MLEFLMLDGKEILQSIPGSLVLILFVPFPSIHAIFLETSPSAGLLVEKVVSTSSWALVERVWSRKEDILFR